MAKLLLTRLLAAVPLLLIVSFIVFLLLSLVPGDAAVTLAGESATPAQIEAMRGRLGLNDPLPVQYFNWIVRALHGDLGTSLFSTQRVTDLIAGRLPVSASLAVVAFTIILLAGIPLGVLAASRPGSVFDRFLVGFSAISLAVPPFLFAVLFVTLFAIILKLLPASGFVPITSGFGPWLSHLILPAIAVSLISIASLARQTRSSMLDVLSQDYIRTARAKGMLSGRIIFQHALKNAAGPIITVVGLQISQFLVGLVLVEFIFALPGFGSLSYQAVAQRDIPLIQGVVLLSAVIVIVVNVVADILYEVFNPRLRH